QKERSRGAAALETDDWVELIPITHSQFVGYDYSKYEVRIARYRRVKSKSKTIYQLVFDFTPFYGNSGGQVGDTGYIESNNEKIAIVDTLKENNLTVHIVEVLPENMAVSFEAVVNTQRRDMSAANHTATHLLHDALCKVLGQHIEQKGSLVTPDYLRFDFSHFQKVTAEELRHVEYLVNEQIRANHPLSEQRDCPMEQARTTGAKMLFGEKYGQTVRVISFGNSVELCGGIHSRATGNLGLFRITSEGSSSAGIRRIEAITGLRAEEQGYSQTDMLTQLSKALGSNKFVESIEKMAHENAEVAQKLDQVRAARDKYLIDEFTNDAEIVNGFSIISKQVDIIPESIRYCAVEIKNNVKDVAIVFGSCYGQKPMLTVQLSESAVALGLNAGSIVREAAKYIDGGGGGQPFYATAGGKNPSGMNDAIKAAVAIIKSKL
ncbi:MAG: alanine--tRNA ligase-related protein, partial [Mucinivorans sp.]